MDRAHSSRGNSSFPPPTFIAQGHHATAPFATRCTVRRRTAPKPIVIHRYEFERDVESYLTTANEHPLLLDVASRMVDTLTTGNDDDASPRWSPDGMRIAFMVTLPGLRALAP